MSVRRGFEGDGDDDDDDDGKRGGPVEEVDGTVIDKSNKTLAAFMTKH